MRLDFVKYRRLQKKIKIKVQKSVRPADIFLAERKNMKKIKLNHQPLEAGRYDLKRVGNDIVVTDENGAIKAGVVKTSDEETPDDNSMYAEEASYNVENLEIVSDENGVFVRPKEKNFSLTGISLGMNERHKKNCQRFDGKDISPENPYPEKVSVIGNNLCFDNNLEGCFAQVRFEDGNEMTADKLYQLSSTTDLSLHVVGRDKSKIFVQGSLKAKLNPVPEKKEIKKTLEGIKKEFSLFPEISERIAYMKKAELSEPEIIEVIETFYNKEGIETSEKPKTLYLNKKGHSLVRNILLDILDGNNVLLEGPKSVGKNVAWETVAWLINKPLAVLKITNNTTNDDVFGTLVTDNSVCDKLTKQDAEEYILAQQNAENYDISKAADFEYHKSVAASTHLVFKQGLLTETLVKGNGIFIFDEMDMGNANFLSSILNTLCDDHSKYFEIPGYGIVPLEKGVIIGATQNGSQYMGTQPQNTATMSRFTKYILPNVPDIKKILLNENSGVSEDVLDRLSTLYSDLYEKVESGEISDVCLNIRGFKRILKNIRRGISYKDAVMNQVGNICPEEDRELISDILL